MTATGIPNLLSRLRFRLPRFSLFTLLLVMTVIALSLTVVLLWREVGPLRAENKRLNEERGTLMLRDRSTLQAIRIPSRFAGEGRESYRVFVPEDSLYWVFVVVNDIPKQGYPSFERYPEHYSILGSGTSLPLFGRLEPGEHVVTIREVRRGPTKAVIQLIVDRLDVSANTPSDRWPTVVPETYCSFGDGVEGSTTPVDDTGRLVLRRRRIMGVTEESLNVSFAMVEPDYPLDGLMAWIEPDPGVNKE
jgi:hypothetical protein